MPDQRSTELCEQEQHLKFQMQQEGHQLPQDHMLLKPETSKQTNHTFITQNNEKFLAKSTPQKVTS